MMKRRSEPEKQRHFRWSDILAFCLALYRILLPQLLVTFLVAAAVTALLFVFLF